LTLVGWERTHARQPLTFLLISPGANLTINHFYSATYMS
jgi:hypothetical protein